MNQPLLDRCPFREKTASRRLYSTPTGFVNQTETSR